MFMTGVCSQQFRYMYPSMHTKRSRWPPFFIHAMSYKYINAALADFSKKLNSQIFLQMYVSSWDIHPLVIKKPEDEINNKNKLHALVSPSFFFRNIQMWARKRSLLSHKVRKCTKKGVSCEPRGGETRSVTPIFYFTFGRPMTSTTQYPKTKKS